MYTCSIFDFVATFLIFLIIFSALGVQVQGGFGNSSLLEGHLDLELSLLPRDGKSWTWPLQA